MEVTEGVQRIHMKLFGGEKALMLMDPVEKEEALDVYKRQIMYCFFRELNRLPMRRGMAFLPATHREMRGWKKISAYDQHDGPAGNHLCM